MKLGIAYNIFDSEELLEGSLKTVAPFFVCAVAQDISNYGEIYDGGLKEARRLMNTFHYQPDLKKPPHENEKCKRNIGLKMCRDAGCTHFLSMDCDEYYDPLEFDYAMGVAEEYDGTACKMWTYFKEPTLRLKEPESYYVPFIHRIKPNQFHGGRYPVYCDPTRALRTENFYEFTQSELMMHHFSYVRKDIERKVRNSSARANIEKSGYSQDYVNAKEGYYVSLYNSPLVRVPNRFEIKIP